MMSGRLRSNLTHDYYLLPRRIPVEGLPATIMIVGGAVSFIWIYWGTVLFAWTAGIGAYALMCFVLLNSMDSQTLRAAGWPFVLMLGGGFVAIMWPWVLSKDR